MSYAGRAGESQGPAPGRAQGTRHDHGLVGMARTPQKKPAPRPGRWSPVAWVPDSTGDLAREISYARHAVTLSRSARKSSIIHFPSRHIATVM